MQQSTPVVGSKYFPVERYELESIFEKKQPPVEDYFDPTHSNNTADMSDDNNTFRSKYFDLGKDISTKPVDEKKDTDAQELATSFCDSVIKTAVETTIEEEANNLSGSDHLEFTSSNEEHNVNVSTDKDDATMAEAEFPKIETTQHKQEKTDDNNNRQWSKESAPSLAPIRLLGALSPIAKSSSPHNSDDLLDNDTSCEDEEHENVAETMSIETSTTSKRVGGSTDISDYDPNLRVPYLSSGGGNLKMPMSAVDDDWKMPDADEKVILEEPGYVDNPANKKYSYNQFQSARPLSKTNTECARSRKSTKSSTAFKPHPAQNSNKASHTKNSTMKAAVRPPKRLLSGGDASQAKEMGQRKRLQEEDARFRKNSTFKARPLPIATLPGHGQVVTRKSAVSRSGKENGTDAYIPHSSLRAKERASYDAKKEEWERQHKQDQIERRNQIIRQTKSDIKELKERLR